MYPPLRVVALLSRQVEAPSLAVSQHNERHPGVESVFQCLANPVVGPPRLLDLNKDGWLRWRHTESEVRPALPSLILWPDSGGIPGVPTEILQQPENDPLRYRLLVGKPALVQPIGDVSKSGFQ
jgi:hypothetical protein